MSPIAQCMRVSTTIGKQWLQNVATHVLDPLKQVVIGVFDQLGGRRLARRTCHDDFPYNNLYVGVTYSSSFYAYHSVRPCLFGLTNCSPA